MNPEDKSLFLDAMEDVQPLKRCSDTLWQPNRSVRAPKSLDLLQLDNFLTTGFLDVLPLDCALEFKREGLQQGVLDKLCRGKYVPQVSLNLRGQSVELCRQQLFVFIRKASEAGARNLLIIHGKGREPQSHPNIVRSYLARWLVEFEEVQAFCPAQPVDGGSGACYVALRKSAQAKLDNRERHAKRSR